MGCEVYYYLTSERYEIDFLVQTSRGHKKLFQITWDMQNKQTVEREERALQQAMQELKVEGEIVTVESYLRQGVKLN